MNDRVAQKMFDKQRSSATSWKEFEIRFVYILNYELEFKNNNKIITFKYSQNLKALLDQPLLPSKFYKVKFRLLDSRSFIIGVTQS